MNGTMAEHFTCPNPQCRKPLIWDDDEDEWRHPSIQDTVDCVLSWFGVQKRSAR